MRLPARDPSAGAPPSDLFPSPDCPSPPEARSWCGDCDRSGAGADRNKRGALLNGSGCADCSCKEPVAGARADGDRFGDAGDRCLNAGADRSALRGYEAWWPFDGGLGTGAGRRWGDVDGRGGVLARGFDVSPGLSIDDIGCDCSLGIGCDNTLRPGLRGRARLAAVEDAVVETGGAAGLVTRARLFVEVGSLELFTSVRLVCAPSSVRFFDSEGLDRRGSTSISATIGPTERSTSPRRE